MAIRGERREADLHIKVTTLLVALLLSGENTNKQIQTQKHKQTLPEAQRTQKLTLRRGLKLAKTWRHLHYLQIWPPDGATCISCKYGHQMAPLALVANLATIWHHLH